MVHIHTKEEPDPVIFPHAVVLIDASWSMAGHENEVVTTFNEYVESVLDIVKTVSLYMFDSNGIMEVFYRKAPAAVRKLTLDDYNPGAMTPLFDSMGKVMQKFDEEAKVQFVTHTDGLENDSKEFDYQSISAYIEKKTKDGWLFTYLGEGLRGQEQTRALQGVKLNFSSHFRSQAMKGLAETTAFYAATGSNAVSAYAGNATGEIDVDEVSGESEILKRRAHPEAQSPHPE